MSERLQAILSEFRQALATLYQDRLVMLILFGSQARGDAQPDSDIDVLVVLKEPVDGYKEIRETGEIVSRLSLRYETVLTCVFVSDKEYEQKDWPLFRNIRREGIIL